MAQQHFYSRVPAKVSMYNKYDGFDTFAHSQGLTKEFIEKELSLVYADKLSKNDTLLVRKGLINPVYFHCCVKSGKFVQGCITYLPLDYTGERSAYFTHTLVYSDEEAKDLLTDDNCGIINTNLFEKDINKFNITSPQSSPISNYPEKESYHEPIQNVQGTYKKYNQEAIKNFIGSILLSLCKKGKNVYFKVKEEDLNASEEATKLVTEIMSILPYTLKENLSFVSYLNDPNQFTSFKLKALSSLSPEIPIDKGVFFDFGVDLYTGINYEEMVNNKTLFNFFYSLLDNNELRLEFLAFMTNAIDNIPSLQNMNLKTLSDIVFLFCGACGRFHEENIIPDDTSLFEFFSIYEKYRLVLNEEYRMRVYYTLNRYPTHHEGIPKVIFSKLIKLYPTDIKPAKKMAMDIVLDLIHTDVMREKLFAFISSNYHDEDDETKRTINYDLCRVFYGGFMQSQILRFFYNNFEKEPIETQDQIIDKLLLSIRTISIQQKILEFIDAKYDYFTLNHRKKFYNTFFEMLPECDELSKALVRILDKHGVKETDDLMDFIEHNLERTIELDYRKRENLLLPILVKDSGYCLDETIKLIFTKWYNRKVYSQFIELLKEKNTTDKTETIIQITNIVPNLEKQVEDKLINNLKGIYSNNQKTSLYVWLEIYNSLKSSSNSVLQYLNENEIINALINSLNDAFDPKQNPQGIDIVRKFAKENKKVRESNNYVFIANYVEMIGNIKINEITKAFNLYDVIPDNKDLRVSMANHINNVIIDRKKQTTQETLYFDICVNHLKDNKVQLDKLYIQYKDIYKRQYFTSHGASANPKKAIEEASSSALKLIFDSCYNICKTSSQLNEAICNSESKLRSCIVDFVNIYGSKSKKWFNGMVSNHENTSFINYFYKSIKEVKPQNSGLFGIFKK